MTVAVPLATRSAAIALMSPVQKEAVKSSIPVLTDSDTSLNGNEESPSDSSLSGSCDETPSLPAIAPIVTVYQSTAGTNKRPQMKYDPEVPLSKEETSAWRREQRRKRNRESAAACRKRQRDRISELEIEVEEWKVKFDEIVKRLGEVEGGNVVGIVGDIERLYPEKKRKCEIAQNERSVSPTVTLSTNACNMVTPPNAQTFLPPVTTSSSVSGIDFPVLQEPIKTGTAFIKDDPINVRVEKGQHLSEKITRPAVKITGAVPTPLAAIESVCDDLLELVPDSILSLAEVDPMSSPQTSSNLAQTGANEVSCGGDEVNELDEFLADAVNWL